jgi:hypothetical protein
MVIHRGSVFFFSRTRQQAGTPMHSTRTETPGHPSIRWEMSPNCSPRLANVGS